jgi:DNA-binding XRE family transcriptional regulator
MTIACKMCNGAGKVGPVHVHREDGKHEWLDEAPCRDCDGTGQWSAERLELYERGQRYRQQRDMRGESLREAAKRLGISPAELSNFELGKGGPAIPDALRFDA